MIRSTVLVVVAVFVPVNLVAVVEVKWTYNTVQLASLLTLSSSNSTSTNTSSKERLGLLYVEVYPVHSGDNEKNFPYTPVILLLHVWSRGGDWIDIILYLFTPVLVFEDDADEGGIFWRDNKTSLTHLLSPFPSLWFILTAGEIWFCPRCCCSHCCIDQ